MILKDIHRRRKEGYKPNTFIGGVGASLSSPNHFEQYFIGLNEEDIQNFQIDANNNISFYIEKDYDIKQFFFKNENDASYYIDSEGYLKKINQGSFKGLPNFKCFYSPSMISHRSGGGYGGFGNMGLLKSMYLPLLEHTENSFINNNEKAKLLYFPNLREIWLQNVGRKSFYGLKLLAFRNLLIFLMDHFRFLWSLKDFLKGSLQDFINFLQGFRIPWLY